MPRRLSNIEYATFLQDVDVERLDMTPWGRIVQWRGIDVLVFRGPREVFLTDVTDLSSAWKGQAQLEYDPRASSWIYRLPESTMEVVLEKAQAVSEAIDVSIAGFPYFAATAALLAVFLVFKR